MFCNDMWVGSQPLKRLFPRLFLVSDRQEERVGDFGSWVDGWCTWSLPWRHQLFVWEESLERDLLQLILLISLKPKADQWGWLGDSTRVFAFQSAYESIMEMSSTAVGLSNDHMELLGTLWKSLAHLDVN